MKTAVTRLATTLAGALILLALTPATAMADCGSISYQAGGGGDPCGQAATLGAIIADTVAVALGFTIAVPLLAAISQSPSEFSAAMDAATGQGTGATADPERVGANSMDPVTPGWVPVDAQDAPQHVRGAAQGFKPRVGRRSGPTTAVHNGRALTSSDGYQRRHLADDLAFERIPREGGRPYPRPPNVLYEHPEMQVAADMRAQARANPDANVDAEVVVDNSMCGTRPFDYAKPLTCDKLLADTMPAGSRMTVWATADGGNTFFHKVIEGTGRLIRP